MVETLSSSDFLSLLDILEDSSAGQSQQIDAYLTIANRLSGEEGRVFLPGVQTHFSRLGKTVLTHITSTNSELTQAALQALGFCVFHSQVVSKISENLALDILSVLCSLVVNSTDKNKCTRALWVISKQSLPANLVGEKVPSILVALESVWNKKGIQSVAEHEALNVIIRMLDQVPEQMGDVAVQWTKLVIPLVVHTVAKVRLRAAAAMEMGLPLLLEKQQEVAAVIEPLMSSKLIPELQKLFMSKNEIFVLKLWPLFVKLLGKLLHKGGPFINSVLHLEELGFRSSSPPIKKMAFIAWKSIIDNFAAKPEILCNGKRLKLLMQPLASIHIRTEALLLTKVEVWWYLAVRLGPNLASNFEQVSVPLLHCTFGSDNSVIPVTASRAVAQSGTPVFSSSAVVNRKGLNTSFQTDLTFPSIQLLGLEMLLHYFLGPEVVITAAKANLQLNLEPLTHPCFSGTSFFMKHAAVLISNVQDGFIIIGKEAPDSLLALIWMNLVSFVTSTIESGTKKDSHGCDALALMLQALHSIVVSEALSGDRLLSIIEATINGIPNRVLASASYQVGKMDVLNGTPALFVITLLFEDKMLAYVENERFFQCLRTLVDCGLSGPTSPLAFGEAVLAAVGRHAGSVQNKESLWMMWMIIVNPLTDTIIQSNEVNQGDALEHNFSAVHSALFFPIVHLLSGTPLLQVTQKSLLSTWSKLYKVFARCSALVVTAEENICCEELSSKMAALMNKQALMAPSMLKVFTSVLQVMVECVDFSPYKAQFQQKHKSPHTPNFWMRKKNKALGNLSTFLFLVVQSLEACLTIEDLKSFCEPTVLALISILSTLFTNMTLTAAVKEALEPLIQPLARLFGQQAKESPKFSSLLLAKLEKLLCDILSCLQTCPALVSSEDLLALLSPLLCVLFVHKNKQHRFVVTQFWNATFAHLVNLPYPDELRQILSQVRQSMPIILPGFEIYSVSEGSGGQSSNESSQLETTISGIQITPLHKRNSLLDKIVDQRNESSSEISRPVSAKLDFGPLKPPLGVGVLEEEASTDFVFIPPATKERVLTEHQREVKGTKRVDIPVMYNDLDSSLDSTVFTLYTQSQIHSQNRNQREQADAVSEGAHGVELRDDAQDPGILTSNTQNYAGEGVQLPAKDAVNSQLEEELAILSEVQICGADVAMESKENPNISGISNVISGTPQKPTSRRQSFLTLEKYAEGAVVTPSNLSKFTGLFIEVPNNESHQSSTSTTQSTTMKHQDLPSLMAGEIEQCSPHTASESEGLLEDKSELPTHSEICPTTTLQSLGTGKDVNTDTQTYMEATDCTSLSQETESQECMGDSPGAGMTSTPSSEPRRSGRRRTRPLLPGEDPKEQREKFAQLKKRPHQDPSNGSDEDIGGHRLRTRAKIDNSESLTVSCTKSRGRMKLSISKERPGSSEPKRRSLRNDTSHSDSKLTDSKTNRQSKCNQLSKSLPESQTECRREKRDLPRKEYIEPGQKRRNTSDDITEVATEKHKAIENSTQCKLKRPTTEGQDHTLKDFKVVSLPQLSSPIQSFELTNYIDPTNHVKDKAEHEQRDPESLASPQYVTQPILLSQTEENGANDEQSGLSSQMHDRFTVVGHCPMETHSHSSLTGEQSQVPDEQSKNEQEDTQLGHRKIQLCPPLPDSMAQTTLSLPNESLKQIVDVHIESGQMNEESCPNESMAAMSSTPAIQSEHRSAISQVPSEVVESQNRSERVDLGGKAQKNNSQEMACDLVQTECQPGERVRCNEIQDELSKSEHNSTKTASIEKANSADITHGGNMRWRRQSSQVSLHMEFGEPLAIGKSSSLSSVDVPIPRTVQPPQTSKDKRQMSEVTGKVSAQENQDMQHKTDSYVLIDLEATASGNSDSTNSELAREEVQVQMNSKTDLLVTPVQIDPGIVPPHESAQNSMEKNQERALCNDNMLLPVETCPPCNHAHAVISNTTLLPECCGLSVQVSNDVGEEIQFPCLEASRQKDVALPPADEMVESKQKEGSDHEENAKPEEKPEYTLGQSLCQFSRIADEQFKKRCKEKQLVSQSVCSNDNASFVQERTENSASVHKVKPKDFLRNTVDQKNDQNQAHPFSQPDVLPQCHKSLFSCQDVCQTSPAKLKELQAVTSPDVNQSPSSARPRVSWSPSASPTTSILKKGQKRSQMEDTPSPSLKFRRVSFANPIQQQELADDIDRSSPVFRTSSPRRYKINTSQPKGSLFPSPRSVDSPTTKSSKKCLISEMSQESHPVRKGCIYPMLVGCTTPVEAVLPQISSSIWSRGLGQLVRARNIKTVGDLSSLLPCEIKSLPIRSPKIFNVKKALRTFEQQCKGPVSEEVRCFDEIEHMTMEDGDTSATQDDKSLARPLQPLDEAKVKETLQQEVTWTPKAVAKLLVESEGLTSMMTPLELSHCSSKQLVQLHENLAGMMNLVVLELQSRVSQTKGNP